MLVLSRKVGERIIISDDITLVVVEIRPGSHGKHKVRLGIEAPREVTIDREEVHDAKMESMVDRLSEERVASERGEAPDTWSLPHE